MKDYIRRRGENVSSMEVEAVVTGHADVLEAAAVGVKAGEGASSEDEILVCVVLREGSAPDLGELLDWCAERMPYFAVPRYLRVMDALPKTPTERVRKVELRDAGHHPRHLRPRARMSDLDLGEAADYILSERPGLDEDVVWAVLNELGEPPAAGADNLALELLARARPEVRRRDARRVIDEWRAYARLAERARLGRLSGVPPRPISSRGGSP